MAERSVVVRFRAVVTDFQRPLKASSATVRDFAAESEKSAKKHRTEWDKVGRQSPIVGLAIGAGLGLAIKKFADFDQAMSGAAAGTQATVNELAALREAAIKAGADTQFSATQAAQAITAMGKAGVSTKDILGGGLTGAMNLAAAGQLEVGQAAEIAATALTQFNLKGNQLVHVSDLYAAAAGKAQGSVEDVAQAMKYAGVTANSMGLSIEETTGVIGLFASKGIIGEQAGTTFRSMLLSLTSPSRIAKTAMDNLGISLYDSSGRFVGLQGAAAELQNKLGPLSEATRNQALGQIFGNESMNGAIALYEGGASAVQDWTEKVNDAGFAQDQARKLTDNWKGDLERLSGSLDSVFVKNGSKFNGSLRGMTQGIEHAVNAFGGLPSGAQTAVVGMTAATAAAVILGGGALALVPRVAAAKAAMVELGIVSEATATKMTGAAGAAGKVAAGAAAVVAAAVAADQLAQFAPGAHAATVETDALGRSLIGVANGLTEARDLGKIFSTGGLFSPEVIKASDALDRFADSAQQALGTNLGDRIDRMGDFGSASTRFTEQVGQIDTALAKLASSGRDKEAGRFFSQIMASVKAANDAGGNIPIEEIRGKFTKYKAAMDAVSTAAGPAGSAINKVTKAAQDSHGGMIIAEGATAATASAMLVLGTNAAQASDQVTELAKVIQSDMDAAASAFQRDTDVLGKYDPVKNSAAAAAAAKKVADAEKAAQDVRERVASKKKRTVSDTQALERAAAKVDEARAEQAKAGGVSLEQSYKDALSTARQFTKDLTSVTKRGLDPNTVAKLLQEGPEKAGPVLQELVGKNSANLIKMSNDAEAQLRKINTSVVEQSRLTSLALNSATDTMTADLDVAMAIAAAKAAHGGKVTADGLAKELRVGVGEVRRIAAEFGIAIDTMPQPRPIPIRADSSQARAAIADARQQLANLDGARAITYIETRIADERDRRQDAANSKGTAAPGASLLTDPNPLRNLPRNATGTSFFQGGLTWVGEQGPEIAELPRGTKIYPADQSKAMASAMAQRLTSVSSSVSSHSETHHTPVYHYGDIVEANPGGYQADMERKKRHAALGEFS